jgi:hypothetical protein
MDQTVSVKNFNATLDRNLKLGEDGIDRCVDLYIWSRAHIKELHKHDATFTQEYVVQRITRCLNVDPVVYLRTASRLGGGESADCVQAGREMIKRFGIYETFRADKLLGPDQMAKLSIQAEKFVNGDEFKGAVDDLRKEIDSVGVGRETKPVLKKISDVKEENNALRALVQKQKQDIHILREKIRLMTADLAWFRKNARPLVAKRA